MKQAAFHKQPDDNDRRSCFAESVLASTHQGVVILGGTRRRIIYANAAFVAITGYALGEAKGKPFMHLLSRRHNRAFYRQIWESVEAKGLWFGEIWARRKNGDDYPSLHTINPVFDRRHGGVLNYVSVFGDITAIKRQQADVGYLAYHDPLTGLPNRMVLIDRLQHALLTHMRNDSRLAVLFVDVDNFKHINDTLGHAVGDVLLQAVAARFQSLLRSGDTVARLGGDEFVILAESCPSRRGIAHIAEKTLDALARPLSIANRDIEVAVSIGIAIAPQDGGNADDLLHAADQAMYRAKTRHGSHFCFFDRL